MSPHSGYVVEGSAAQRARVTVLTVVLPHHPLLTKVRLISRVFARRRGTAGRRRRRRRRRDRRLVTFLIFNALELSLMLLLLLLYLKLALQMLLMAVVAVVVSRALRLIEPVICNHHEINVTTSHHRTIHPPNFLWGPQNKNSLQQLFAPSRVCISRTYAHRYCGKREKRGRSATIIRIHDDNEYRVRGKIRPPANGQPVDRLNQLKPADLNDRLFLSHSLEKPTRFACTLMFMNA